MAIMRARPLLILVFMGVFLADRVSAFDGIMPAKNISDIFHAPATDYIRAMHNLSTIEELNEFFVVQGAIYVDNVHTIYQRFFYKLLGELPRSPRWEAIKVLAQQMDAYLEVPDEELDHKMRIFETTMIPNGAKQLYAVFKYDPQATLLSTDEFAALLLANHAAEVLSYAKGSQMRQFVQHTGDGIRLFLILNRPLLDKEDMLEFKMIVDAFLEREDFESKWACLQAFLLRAQMLLDVQS